MARPLVVFTVASAAALVARHFLKRRLSSTEGESEKPIAEFVIIPGLLKFDESEDDDAPEAGPPGDRCEYDDGLAAWDHEGNCKPYWFEGVTEKALVELATARWEERGKPSITEMCFAKEDPLGGEYAAPEINPIFQEIVAGALHDYYGRTSTFPAHEDSHKWVQMAWKRALALMMRELCGWQ